MAAHAGDGPGKAVKQSEQVAYRLSRFSKEYRGRLLKSLCNLNDYCVQQGRCSLKSLLKRPAAADAELAQYVMCRHAELGDPGRSLVKHALLGAQHLSPKLKGRLHTAWAYMRVWEEKRKTSLRPPLPMPLWCFMLGLARAHAKTATSAKLSRKWNIFALLVEIGWLCLLRPGELLKLQWNDFSLPGSFTLGQQHAAVRIISPKNRRQFGAQQFVILKNPSTIYWIRALWSVKPDDALWSHTPQQFAKCFRQICLELGLEHCHFTPGSLRPGGATHLYGKGMSVSTLRFVGRWTAEKSLEHYIQQAMATQILNNLEDNTVKRLLKLGPWCIAHIQHDLFQPALAIFAGSKKAEGNQLIAWCSKYAEFAE